jgi:copper transporter 1
MGDHSHHGDHANHSHGDVLQSSVNASGAHNHDHADIVVTNESEHDHAHPGPHDTMMHMFFHGGETEYILFEFWKTTELGGLLGSMLAVFVLAFMYEALKFYREHLYRHSFRTIQYNTVTVPVENGGSVKETQKTVQVRMLSLMHMWQTVLHVVQVIISYFLMLIFMTYNVWLCLAVILGAGSGYFFFGWKKSLVVDITEHCH